MLLKPWVHIRARTAAQSGLIIASMAALLATVGWLLAGQTGLVWAAGLGIFVMGITPRVPPRFLMRAWGARALLPSQAPQLYAIVGELARRAEIKRTPTLYYLPKRELNAFTLGTPSKAVIGITDGLMRTLDEDELAGVLAHEIAHIKFRDAQLMSLAEIFGRATNMLSSLGKIALIVFLPMVVLGLLDVSMLAIVALIFAPSLSKILRLALSRSREFDADAEAARLTGNPMALASALQKIEQVYDDPFSRLLLTGRAAPNPSTTLPEVLRSHPQTRARIDKLIALDGASDRPALPRLETPRTVVRRTLPKVRQRPVILRVLF